MNEEKGAFNSEFEDMDKEDDKKKEGQVSRARNRTVMLTPEMTGQVRSLLQQGQGMKSAVQQPTKQGGEFLPPVVDWEGGGEVRPTVDAQRPVEPGQGFVRLNQQQPVNPPQPSSDTARTSGFTGKFDPVSSVIGASPIQRQEVVSNPTTTFFRPSQQNLGTSFGQGAPVQTPTVQVSGQNFSQPVASVAPKSRIVGFLVSFDKGEFGEVYEIRAGRIMLSSKNSEQPDSLVISDETISPLHAIIRATKEGKIQVLDQLSEYGTGVLHAGASEEVEVTGNLVDVHHGDIVRFGKRFFVVCCIPPLPATVTTA